MFLTIRKTVAVLLSEKVSYLALGGLLVHVFANYNWCLLMQSSKETPPMWSSG